MTEPDDLVRLRQEYAERKIRSSGGNSYSPFNLPYLFIIQQRQRDLLKQLKGHQILNLDGRRILEVGCGGGGVLMEYLSLGATPNQVFGVDLLFDRLVEAQQKLPLAGISCADGQDLPYQANTFDLVLQYTAFSSVLDGVIKQKMANEMQRVLSPGGTIIWYDFWLNPTNPQTRGIQPKEIRALFGGCSIRFYKISLAPPIARRIVPVSWGLGVFLESLGVFNSHYLALMQKG